MARTSERTLLASLGFADPDRSDRLHDWACQYVCTEEGVPWGVVNHCLGRATEWRDTSNINNRYRDVRQSFRWYRPETEYVVKIGKSARPVGFLDVVIPYDVVWRSQYERDENGEETECWGRSISRSGNVLVEVKIHPISVGAAIRQIKTYLSCLAPGWELHEAAWIPVLITAFDMPADDLEILGREKIKHLRLGDKFDSYCERRRSEITECHSDTI